MMGGSLAAGAAMFGRALAEGNMESTCVIGRPTGKRERDAATGQLVDELETVYDGPCEFKYPTAGATAAKGANGQGQDITTQLPTLKLPVATSGAVRANHQGRITGNDLDSSLVGLTFRVTGRHGATYATSRRLIVEVIAGG